MNILLSMTMLSMINGLKCVLVDYMVNLLGCCRRYCTKDSLNWPM